MKNSSLKQYWWIIFIIIIPGLPVLLNFLVFKPTCQFSVGRLQDWMAFWGSYLGATISSLAAFAILYIQRRDHRSEMMANEFKNQVQNAKERQRTLRNNARILEENQQENSKTRQLLSDLLIYQQESQWLSALRVALVNYISAYRENEIMEIINSIQESSYESIQEKIKALYDTLAQADANLSLVICENNKTVIGDTYQEKLGEFYARITAIIKDIQLLICSYYHKTPMSSEMSDNLNNLLVSKGIELNTIDYNRFTELANQIIIPLPGIFEAIRTLCHDCMKDEKQRIDTLLVDSFGEKRTSI